MDKFRKQKRGSKRQLTTAIKQKDIPGYGLDDEQNLPKSGRPTDERQNGRGALLSSAPSAPASLVPTDDMESLSQAPAMYELRRSKRSKPCKQHSVPISAEAGAQPQSKAKDASIHDVIDEIATSIIQDTNIKGISKPKKERKRKDVTISKPKKASKKELELTAAASQSLKIWSESEIELAMKHLREVDPTLAKLLDTSGPTKPERLLPKGCKNVFSTLTRTIMGQQLATSAARVIYGRFLDLVKKDFHTPVLPADVLPLDDDLLKGVGLSRQKASYVKSLAEHFDNGVLSDEKMAGMDDQTLITELTKVKGIGRWTVDMFAMFDLGHTDVLPVGDLGVRNGMRGLYNLKEAPSIAKMQELTDCWRPYRSLGSYFMWHALDMEKKAAKAAKLEATPKKGKAKKLLKDTTTSVPL